MLTNFVGGQRSRQRSTSSAGACPARATERALTTSWRAWFVQWMGVVGNDTGCRSAHGMDAYGVQGGSNASTFCDQGLTFGGVTECLPRGLAERFGVECFEVRLVMFRERVWEHAEDAGCGESENHRRTGARRDERLQDLQMFKCIVPVGEPIRTLILACGRYKPSALYIE